MEIKEKYVRHYWYQMVEDQLVDEYQSQGYTVERGSRIDDQFIADLYAVRNDEKIIIEIVSERKRKEDIIKLYQKAQSLDCKFRVVSANYSHFQTLIEFDEFEDAFVGYLNAQGAGDFDEFGGINTVEGLSEYEFKTITVFGDNIKVNGTCIVELNSSFDSEGDTDFTYHVPVTFICTLRYDDGSWSVDDCDLLDIDSSQLND